MKTLAFAVIVITVLTSNTQTNAQPAGPMGPGQPPKSMPKGPEARGLEPVTSFQGKIVKTISNDDFVYDGFYLLSNQDSLLVKFPPHRVLTDDSEFLLTFSFLEILGALKKQTSSAMQLYKTNKQK